jgi:pre-mRNA-splicing factor 18
MSSLDGLKSLIKSKRQLAVSNSTPAFYQDELHPITTGDESEGNASKRPRPSSDESRPNSDLNTGSKTTRNANDSTEYTTFSSSVTVLDSDIVEYLRRNGEPIRLFGESDDDRNERARELMDTRASQSECSPPVRTSESLDPFNGYFKRLSEDVTLGDIFLTWLHNVIARWHSIGELGPQVSGSSAPDQKDRNVIRLTLQALEPLLEAYMSGTLDDSLSGELRNIAACASARKYRDANHAYLQLSIGNKPWPIGVGHVFIQERASMDKIATSSHIMNNEKVRAYIQSVKRLLNIAAEFWPAIDPGQRWNS